MINIDLDNLNEETVYEAFNVDGNEAEALKKIARAGGYTVKFIEGVLSKRRKDNSRTNDFRSGAGKYCAINR